MVNIRQGNRIHPTHETRFRPYFEENTILTEILSNEMDEITFSNYEVTLPNATPPKEQPYKTQIFNLPSDQPTT